MQQTLTAKLKLEVTQEQKQQLRVTSLAYRDGAIRCSVNHGIQSVHNAANL
jgi:hypothetical protein